MLEDYDEPMARLVDPLIASAPLQDLRPATARRIEAACLARLQRRKKLLPSWECSFLGALEAVLASLLGGGHLLWSLGQALVIYGAHVH